MMGRLMGHFVSFKTREKISKTMKGKHISPETEFKKGQLSLFKGRHQTEEVREKLSEMHKGKHPKTEFKKGHFAEKGIHYSLNTEFKKGHFVGKGKESLNWKGGIKLSQMKTKSKRRGLGSIPLNEYFKGSVAHHIDRVYVVYMLEEDHESIWHSVLKNINMDAINALAFNYLGG